MLLSGDEKKPRIRSSNAGKSGWQVPCQTVIHDYNLFMGVDTSNQLIGLYCCLIKSPSCGRLDLPHDWCGSVWCIPAIQGILLPAPSSHWTRKEAAVQSSSSSWVTLMTMGSTYTRQTWTTSSLWLYVYSTAGIFCWKEKLTCALSHQ